MKRLAGRLNLGHLVAIPARESSLPAIEACVKGAADYFRRTEGPRPARELAADRLADALADRHRRLFVLTRAEDEATPLGILDLALDTPHKGEVTVALLAVMQQERRRGLGREVAEALFSLLAREGFKAVRLGVAPGEDAAASFWSSLGLWEVGKDDGVRLFEMALRTA